MWMRHEPPDCSDGEVDVVSISGATKVAAVVGWPIEHSLSPAIHNAGFVSTGVDWTYVALGVRPEHGDKIVEMSAGLGVAGLSVTMPYKTTVAAQVHEVDETSRRLESVNTVSFAEDHRSRGHTTDGDGLLGALASEGVEVSGRSVLVLGTGGAGRSVIEAFSRRSPRRLMVSNRSSDRSEPFGIASKTERVDWAERTAAVAAADIVVNCTSVGMGTDRSTPFDTACVGSQHTIVDLVYHPLETRLLEEARRRGARPIGGLGMLVHQAALQQKIWTGHLPDVELMSRVARSALAARG